MAVTLGHLKEMRASRSVRVFRTSMPSLLSRGTIQAQLFGALLSKDKETKKIILLNIQAGSWTQRSDFSVREREALTFASNRAVDYLFRAISPYLQTAPDIDEW